MKRLLQWLALAAAVALGCGWSPPGKPPFRAGAVVAFIGGEDMVAAQRHGYLETVLMRTTAPRGLRFRCFAREGDTVFEQRRDFNFPTVLQQLDRAGATVVIAQFGQVESLRGPGALPEFIAASERLLETLTRSNRACVLLSPTPFTGNDAAVRNAALKSTVAALREIAGRRGLCFVDLFTPLLPATEAREPLTRDGLHLTAHGHWHAARETGRQLAVGDVLSKPPDPRTGVLRDARAEALRQAIIAKNQLWFDYSRPQNWAFLGGDRISQPSSRDHRDPKVRWFPAEMEKFLPLIETKEREIAARAEEWK